jgi:hypothetical protein
LRQGRSVETLKYNAEASLQGHFVEYLRSTRGDGSAGHSRLVPPEPQRDSDLEQLHDLTGRPDMNVCREAFADLLRQKSLHRRSPAAKSNTVGGQRKTPVAAAGHHDRVSACTGTCPFR